MVVKAGVLDSLAPRHRRCRVRSRPHLRGRLRAGAGDREAVPLASLLMAGTRQAMR